MRLISSPFLARVCPTKQEQFVWTWKGIPNNRYWPGNWVKYKILHIYFSRLLLKFQINCMTFWMTLGEHLTMSASPSMFNIAIDYKNKTNMKVAASNINIKIHQLFSKQRILGVFVTIELRKIPGYLTRTCSWIPCRQYLWK